ncbi:hypothetical protein C1646_671741 [Rhizophagus diaphanus]|nr:hypothetical protein C1646_671741 [Rhizophagus diaphanus] [Rhizophagus sp. MUCL 43196]
MKQIQNEMDSLQEQEDSSNNLTPIPKPSENYVNIPKTLKLSKTTLNDYQNHIRDLVKLHADLKKEYKNQNPKTIDLVISKFKKRNMTFLDTINDWAIKIMIKRSINNIRNYNRRKEHDNKKVNKVSKKSKNKESADDNSNTNINQNNGSFDEINETPLDAAYLFINNLV